MKINNIDIILLYRSILFDKRPPDRNKCPSINNITRLYRGDFIFFKKNVLNHINNCIYCSQEIQLISNIVKKENTIIDNIISNKSKVNSNLLGARFHIIYNYLFRKYKIISLGFILVLIASLFFLNKYPINNHLRSTYSNQSILIELNKHTNNLIELKWNQIINSNYYVVNIFNDELSLIWKSEKIYSESVILPLDVINNMEEGRKYYYIVSCYLYNGSIIESQIDLFIL